MSRNVCSNRTNGSPSPPRRHRGVGLIPTSPARQTSPSGGRHLPGHRAGGRHLAIPCTSRRTGNSRARRRRWIAPTRSPANLVRSLSEGQVRAVHESPMVAYWLPWQRWRWPEHRRQLYPSRDASGACGLVGEDQGAMSGPPPDLAEDITDRARLLASPFALGRVGVTSHWGETALTLTDLRRRRIWFPPLSVGWPLVFPNVSCTSSTC